MVFDVTQGLEYSRSGNPTRNCVEKCIAALENGKHGRYTESSMYFYSTVINVDSRHGCRKSFAE